ncbi:MAG: glycosyltransferase, partial [candidate division KSB1 bacterium]|nr:glycosyltransferase [candidate division KSB1 bacterium]
RVLPSLTNSPFQSSKRAALAVGVEYSCGEILLFTDIDCAPPPAWAQTMVSFFEEETLLTAGFSPQTAASPLWNQLLLLDAAAAAFAAGGGIKRGRGVTCTGRNLAYRRSAYTAVGGFAGLPNTLSGDDDFILQRISGLPYGKVRYAFCRQAVVPAVGPPNLRAFFHQKTRHLSAGTAFPLCAKLVYAAFHAANLIIWISALFVFISPLYALPLVIKLVLDRRALQKFLDPFCLRAGLPAFFLWEILFVVYHLYCGILARSRKLRW